MPLLGVGYVMTLVVRPTVRSFGIPLMVAVSDAMEAVIVSTQVTLLILSVTMMINDHVLPGLRHQPALLFPQQRGARGREEPLESVEDGED